MTKLTATKATATKATATKATATKATATKATATKATATTAGKATATAKKDMLVTFARKGAEREQRNPLLVPVVLLDELKSAGETAADFAMNLLSGRVDPRITEAAAKRGGLKRLLADTGILSGTDCKALATVLAVPVEKRVSAWEAHADTVKRFRGVSLQGIAKGLRLLDKPTTPAASSAKGQDTDDANAPSAKLTSDAAELAATKTALQKMEVAFKALVDCVVRAVSDPGMSPAQRVAKIKALTPIADAIDAETP